MDDKVLVVDAPESLVERTLHKEAQPETFVTNHLIPVKGKNRNRTCHCGSGLKMKNCPHYRQVHHPVRKRSPTASIGALAAIAMSMS